MSDGAVTPTPGTVGRMSDEALVQFIAGRFRNRVLLLDDRDSDKPNWLGPGDITDLQVAEIVVDALTEWLAGTPGVEVDDVG